MDEEHDRQAEDEAPASPSKKRKKPKNLAHALKEEWDKMKGVKVQKHADIETVMTMDKMQKAEEELALLHKSLTTSIRNADRRHCRRAGDTDTEFTGRCARL
eukprot:TRINITY_DN10400_c0_g1_i2.p3 TRINITY_DN10400_c0_g1~~TRINITY_DN10400_c0_g1_i2.p3  ORF type:complete len:102 (-),score=22.74 TRINITY_DN10400_c0_g1_i2:1091-1396(-)